TTGSRSGKYQAPAGGNEHTPFTRTILGGRRVHKTDSAFSPKLSRSSSITIAAPWERRDWTTETSRATPEPCAGNCRRFRIFLLTSKGSRQPAFHRGSSPMAFQLGRRCIGTSDGILNACLPSSGMWRQETKARYASALWYCGWYRHQQRGR